MTTPQPPAARQDAGAAFTPGPWELDFHGELDGTRMYFVHRSDSKALSICADNDADARLIAAAPSLYSAASEAFDFLGGMDGAAEVRDLLLHALMKARGQ